MWLCSHIIYFPKICEKKKKPLVANAACVKEIFHIHQGILGLAKTWMFDACYNYAPGNTDVHDINKRNWSSYGSVRVRSTVNNDDSIFSQIILFMFLGY